MDFALSEEQRHVVATVREFAEREIRPHAAAWDREGAFPREVLERLGALGFMGVAVPEAYGGGGADLLTNVLVVEGIARYDASVALTVASHTGLASAHIVRFASDAQRRRYLPGLASARSLGAWCLTEAGSGSDAAALRTRAVSHGGRWVLSGSKMFVSQGSVGDVYVVLASTGREAGRRGISAFIVERGAPGLRTGRRIEKLGLRAADTAEVILDEVAVPGDQLIGSAGEGFAQALAILDGGRVGMAAWCLGIGRGALEESLAYAREREQFGKPIASLQAIQWMLADMATRLDAARLVMFRAAHLHDTGRPCRSEAAMAKLLASEAAMWAATKAVQIHGGYGYICEYPVERYMRDAKLGEIGEGTSEIQRLVIARALIAGRVADL